MPTANATGSGAISSRPNSRAGVPTTTLFADSFSLPVKSTMIPITAIASCNMT
jgi:hypothetical protein